VFLGGARFLAHARNKLPGPRDCDAAHLPGDDDGVPLVFVMSCFITTEQSYIEALDCRAATCRGWLRHARSLPKTADI
jgi:hypothetical protein